MTVMTVLDCTILSWYSRWVWNRVHGILFCRSFVCCGLVVWIHFFVYAKIHS